MSPRLQRFLTVSGSVLLAAGSVRFYRVIRRHAEDPRFAPHLLVTLLSLWVASSILRVGLKKRALNRRRAISLIRSGSVLLGIWSYRLILYIRYPNGAIMPFQAYLAPFYMAVGTIVMCAGLRVSRRLRRETRQPVTAEETLSPVSLVEDGIKE